MGILYAIGWWIGLTGLGWAAFGLGQRHFHPLADKGYAVSKILGLVLFTYILWLGGSLHLIPFGTWSAVIVAILLFGFGLRQLLKHPPTNLSWKLLLAEEGIFSVALFGWSIVRSYNPRIEGVEKLMDIAILNSLLRSTTFPPLDTWFSGSSLNYYYFGHMLVAALAKLVHVPAQYAFDLALAGTFALCSVIIFSLVYTLGRSWITSAASIFLLTLSSNLDPAIQALKKTPNYIFFGATRLDPYTINEFPLYSFTVADLHAHVLGLPIALGVVSLLYVVLASAKLHWWLVAGLGLLLGATGPTNSFDLVIYGGFVALIFLLRARNAGQARWWQLGISQSLAIGALAGTLYLPFYLNFHAPVGGVGVSLFKTGLGFILVNFGILFFCCLPILPRVWSRLNWLHSGRDAKALGPSEWFGILLVVMGVLMILAPEFVYLKDIYNYQNPPYDRANTIFKVYYQAWAVLAIAAGYGISLVAQLKWRFKLGDIYVVAFGGLLAMSIWGSYTAVKAYIDSKPQAQKAWTLDGYQYLTIENPDQLSLINYINQQIEGQPRMLEAAGESYTQRSKVSAYTGLPTILGWASHEWGWRYSPTEWDVIARRMGLIEQLYKETDPHHLVSMLHEQQISYIVASDVEREQYSLSTFDTIAQVAGAPVFVKGNYALYKVP